MYTTRDCDQFNQTCSQGRVHCPWGVCGAVEGMLFSMPSCRSDTDACSSVSAGNGLMLLKSTCRIRAAARICSGNSSSLRTQRVGESEHTRSHRQA